MELKNDDSNETVGLKYPSVEGQADAGGGAEVPDEDTLLDRLIRWEAAYLGGDDPTPESICLDQPSVTEALRERIARQKKLYAMMGLRKATPTADDVESLPSFPGHDVLREVGRGGMGIVYMARDLRLGRIVAIKTLAEARHARPDQLERFLLEARAVARLRHPNIISIHAIGEDPKRPYLSLEYVEGGNLAERLAVQPMAATESAGLLETLARAVHSAHDKGIVHRDLKPSNVLLTAEGEPKISDFGLAKLIDGESGRTLTEQILGTPSFMAPEQAEGHSRQAGPAADVYALGAILYQALTGRPPFLGGSAMETLKLVTSTEPVPPRMQRPDVPRDLETICLKCLEKEATRRYRTAADLAEDLKRFQEGRPIVARPVGPVERLWRWGRRNRQLALTSAALVLTLILGIPALAGLWLRAQSLRARAEVERDHAERSRDRALAAVNVLLSAETDESLGPEVLSYRKVMIDAGLKAARELVDDLEGDPRAESSLADAYSALAEVLRNAGDAAALETGRKAIALAERLDERAGHSLESRGHLAKILHRVSAAMTDAERLSTIRRSNEIIESLRASSNDSEGLKLLHLLGTNQYNIGHALSTAKRIPEAIEAFEAAQRALDEAAGLDDREPQLLNMAGKNLLYLGRLYKDRIDLALAAERRAVAIYRKLLARQPDEVSWAHQLWVAYDEMGQRCLNAERWDEAIDAFENARRILQELAARPSQAVSSFVSIQEGLAVVDFNLREAYDSSPVRYARQRRELTREMYQICERLSGLKPLTWNGRVVHARSALDESAYQEEEGRGVNFELLLESERIWQEIYRNAPGFDLARAYLVIVRRKIAEVLEARGRRDEAAERRRQSLTTVRGAPDLLYEIARGYASTAGLVGRLPSQLDARQLASQRAQLVAETVAMLREAVADGFKDSTKVRREPAFDSVRSLTEFQAILLDLEFPSEPFAAPLLRASP